MCVGMNKVTAFPFRRDFPRSCMHVIHGSIALTVVGIARLTYFFAQFLVALQLSEKDEFASS
jgi:hypothetical protein